MLTFPGGADIITKVADYQVETNPRTRRSGFTLVEVLVVILILGVLMSIMLPSLSRSSTKMRIERTVNNLRVIGVFIKDYHLNNEGLGAPHSDGGCWNTPTDGNPKNHYWGYQYGADKELFNSPLTWNTVEERSDGSRADGHKFVDFGFNGVCAKWSDDGATFQDVKTGLARDLDSYPYPATTIWAHDHSEPMIDGDGDAPCYAFGQDQNAFNKGHADFNPDGVHRENSELALQEIYRNLGSSCVLWADGHVSKVSMAEGWKPEWYTGGIPEAQTAWEEHEGGKYTQPAPYPYGQAYIGRF